MGDVRLPPQVKTATDVTVVSTSFMGWLQAIPWSDIAAGIAAFYTSLLIVGWFIDRRKKK